MVIPGVTTKKDQAVVRLPPSSCPCSPASLLAAASTSKDKARRGEAKTLSRGVVHTVARACIPGATCYMPGLGWLRGCRLGMRLGPLRHAAAGRHAMCEGGWGILNKRGTRLRTRSEQDRPTPWPTKVPNKIPDNMPTNNFSSCTFFSMKSTAVDWGGSTPLESHV